jgi:hypothetical protein
MSGKHTPGPWEADEYRAYAGSMNFGHIAIWAPDHDKPGERWFLGDVRVTGDKQREERIANAHLIAAAPALYESLKEACDIIHELSRYANNNGAMIGYETFAEGLAALAQARGEQP